MDVTIPWVMGMVFSFFVFFPGLCVLLFLDVLFHTLMYILVLASWLYTSHEFCIADTLETWITIDGVENGQLRIHSPV